MYEKNIHLFYPKLKTAGKWAVMCLFVKGIDFASFWILELFRGCGILFSILF